jgi:hypothetical protein
MVASLPSKSLVDLVSRDSVKPGLETPIVLQAFQFVKRIQKNVLGQVLGILAVIDHAIDEIQDPTSIFLVNRVERLKVTSAGFSNDLGLFGLQRTSRMGEAFRAELNYQDDLRQQKLQENPFLIASYHILNDGRVKRNLPQGREEAKQSGTLPAGKPSCIFSGDRIRLCPLRGHCLCIPKLVAPRQRS